MDGAHDLGGMQGFGPATWPGAEQALPNDWDARAFALALAPALAQFQATAASSAARAASALRASAAATLSAARAALQS